jgi:hypothetical protein
MIGSFEKFTGHCFRLRPIGLALRVLGFALSGSVCARHGMLVVVLSTDGRDRHEYRDQ